MEFQCYKQQMAFFQLNVWLTGQGECKNLQWHWFDSWLFTAQAESALDRMEFANFCFLKTNDLILYDHWTKTYRKKSISNLWTLNSIWLNPYSESLFMLCKFNEIHGFLENILQTKAALPRRAQK